MPPENQLAPNGPRQTRISLFDGDGPTKGQVAWWLISGTVIFGAVLFGISYAVGQGYSRGSGSRHRGKKK